MIVSHPLLTQSREESGDLCVQWGEGEQQHKTITIQFSPNVRPGWNLELEVRHSSQILH